MDVYRITELFKSIMGLYPDETRVILAVVKPDHFNDRDVQCSFIAAEYIDEDSFNELQKGHLVVSKMSLKRFRLFFNGHKTDLCKNIMEEMDEDDINLTFDILELVMNTEGSKQDKFNVVFTKYRAKLSATHEGKVLLEEMRKHIK